MVRFSVKLGRGEFGYQECIFFTWTGGQASGSDEKECASLIPRGTEKKETEQLL